MESENLTCYCCDEPIELTKKNKINKKTDKYYRDEILIRKITIQHVETHLKEN